MSPSATPAACTQSATSIGRQAVEIATALDEAGVDSIEVAHGDGLAGSSFNYGFGATPTWNGSKPLRPRAPRQGRHPAAARHRHRAQPEGRPPGRGPRGPVATHCTEADISAQHIEAARELGMDTVGFLMMSHMTAPDALAVQAKLMESYGATCVYVVDSGGAMTMRDIAERSTRCVKP
jgi:4-hydroxy 2-oxovalerate aldolase